MDIKIKTDEENFKFRVNGLIINDNKALLVDINNNGFLCLPGGHVQIGEDTKEAVVRETMEEVGVTSKTQKLFAVIENFFKNKKGKSFHELSFYYLMENASVPKEKQHDYVFVENDDGKLMNLDFKWVPLDKVDEYNIKPDFLKEILKEGKFDFKHHVVK